MPVELALLLPLTGAWSEGGNIAGAAAIAVEKVNSDSKMLPGHVLWYKYRDSGCSASKGLMALGNLMEASTIHAVHIYAQISLA